MKNYKMEKERIDYIDGIKGLCGIWIVLFHYLLAFAPFGFIGWCSGIKSSECFSYYFQNFPYSILTNCSFPLYLFFAIISFLPAIKFFKEGKNQSIKKQAVVRYFRFAPLIVATALIGYIIYALNLYENKQVGLLLNNSWISAFNTTSLSFKGAIANGLWKAIIFGESDYCSVLWCMNIIFWGSYISYAIILLFGSMKRRWIIYTALFLLTFIYPKYTAFLAGIVAADFIANRNKVHKRCEWKGLLLIFLGLIVGIFPKVCLNNIIEIYTLYGISSLFFLVGCYESKIIQKILSLSWITRVGRISFSLILIHFMVLISFSSWLFVKVYSLNSSYPTALILVILTAIPVNWIAAIIFNKLVEKPTNKLSHWIGKLFYS